MTTAVPCRTATSPRPQPRRGRLAVAAAAHLAPAAVLTVALAGFGTLVFNPAAGKDGAAESRPTASAMLSSAPGNATLSAAADAMRASNACGPRRAPTPFPRRHR